MPSARLWGPSDLDLRSWARSLPSMGYHLRIKICGVTTPEDAREAALLGADAVGLNFAPGSPRCIDGEMARAILEVLPPLVTPVSVWARLSLKEIYPQVDALGRVRVIQWHGLDHEPPAPFPYQTIPAFQVRDCQSLALIERYLEGCRSLGRLPAALLLDGYAPGQLGGTGHPAPWDLLADFRPGVPIILAGGLTPENVAEAVSTVRPHAVDVASGVEKAPGQKDPDRMQQFITNARAAAEAVRVDRFCPFGK
jgi:phosphoribosylanthranilate isomerase